MKEMWKKYKRQIQIAGGICLIAALGIGGYVAANQDTAVQTLQSIIPIEGFSCGFLTYESKAER